MLRKTYLIYDVIVDVIIVCLRQFNVAFINLRNSVSVYLYT